MACKAEVQLLNSKITQLKKEWLKARNSENRIVRERNELNAQVEALKSDLANTQARLEEERKKFWEAIAAKEAQLKKWKEEYEAVLATGVFSGPPSK